MNLIKEELYLCDDCMLVAVNGDTSGIEDSDRLEEVSAGLVRVGRIVPNFDSETSDGVEEFSRWACDSCRGRMAGRRHRFSALRTVADLGLSP